MKKQLGGVLALAAAAVLAGCASAKKDGAAGAGQEEEAAPKGPYVIAEGDGVVGYFTFDEDDIEGNEIPDHSGQGLDVATGARAGSVLTDGHNGNAILLEGDDYIVLDQAALEGSGLTVAAWVNPTEWKDWARFMDVGNTVTDLWVGKDAESQRLCLAATGAAAAAKILCDLPPEGVWTHLAVTASGTEAALYVNGALAARQECNVTIESIRASAAGIYLGRSNWATDPLFVGAMDEILVAGRAFSAREIAAVYAGVIPPDAED